MQIIEELKPFEIPGTVMLSEDPDGCLKVNVETALSIAEIYLHGAHVTSFQKRGEEPLLFMSQSACREHGKMVHGGIPICFPWFGARDGETLSHGFARNNTWDLIETNVTSTGEVQLCFQLPHVVMLTAGWAPVEVRYSVTVGAKLTLELKVRNTTQELFLHEECLHSYFQVGAIQETTIYGLKGLHYLDKTENLSSSSTGAANNCVTPVLAPSSTSGTLSCCAPSAPSSSSASAILATCSKLETYDEVPIVGETNRIYLNSTEAIEIHDHSWKRTIRIEKMASRSTVVWNPWIEKSKLFPDLGNEDYQQMLCVESGNVREYLITLAPGESSAMKVILKTLPASV